MLEGLISPGETTLDLAKRLRCRFADGRETDLVKFPLDEALGRSEPRCAEEIAFSVADGRSVTTLVNTASPRSCRCDAPFTERCLPPARSTRRARAALFARSGAAAPLRVLHR